MKNIVNSVILGGFGTNNVFNYFSKLIKYDINQNNNIFIVDTNNTYTNQFADELIKNNYNVIYYDLTNLNKSETYNPLSFIFNNIDKENDSEIVRLVGEFASTIVKSYGNNSIDPFWEDSSTDLITALILTCLTNLTDEQKNLNSVYNLLKLSSDNFDEFKSILSKSSPQAYTLANGYINAPTDTRGGIYSVASQKLRLFVAKDSLSKFLSYSSFNFNEIKDKKTAIIFNNFDVVNVYNDIIVNYIYQLYTFINNNKLNMSFYIENIDTYKRINYFVNILRTNKTTVNFRISTLNKESLIDLYGKSIIELLNVIDGDNDEFENISKINSTNFKFPKNKLKDIESVDFCSMSYTSSDLIRRIDEKLAQIEKEEQEQKIEEEK